MKTLINCGYCMCLFEDPDGDSICNDCATKYFIDMAIASIEQGISDLEDARKIEKEHMTDRNRQIKILSQRLDQLQQVE